MKSVSFFAFLLFLCAGCSFARIPKISISDPLLAKWSGLPMIPVRLISYEDMPMRDLTHMLRYLDSQESQKALAVLAEGRAKKDLLAGLAVNYLRFIALTDDKSWKTRYNAITALKDIGPRHATSAVCELWEIARHEREIILKEHAREALEAFPAPPAPTEEECRKRWKKRGFIVFHHPSEIRARKRAPEKPMEVYFW